MSRVRATVLICACALVAKIAASPAPPRRSDNKESKIIQENFIAVRKMPNAYFYPFSLWPLPKFPVRDPDDHIDTFHYRRNLQHLQIKQNKR